MKYLVGIGACYVDTILTVSQYPSEDDKLRASTISRRRGGNCPNSLEVLQQFLSEGDNVSLVLCSVLPSRSSPATEYIRTSLGPKVDLKHCIYREDNNEAASSYIIKSLSTGSRTIVNYNELSEMTTDEFAGVTDALGNEANWFHFEGRIPETTSACITYIRDRVSKARISVEVEKPGRPGLEELAMLADVVFYSKGWAVSKGYQTARECLDSEGRQCKTGSLLCCTWGDEGAVALDIAQREYATAEVYKIEGRSVTDSIGAGDTFIAGMLYGLVFREGWDLQRKLTFANELAGRKVIQEGFGGLRAQMEPQWMS